MHSSVMDTVVLFAQLSTATALKHESLADVDMLAFKQTFTLYPQQKQLRDSHADMLTQCCSNTGSECLHCSAGVTWGRSRHAALDP